MCKRRTMPTCRSPEIDAAALLQSLSEGSGAAHMRVRHPILHLEVVGADGTRASAHRVYCGLRGQSVSVGVCCACVRCEAIVGGPAPAVECTLPVGEGERAVVVGQVLGSGTLAVDEESSVEDALRLLYASGRQELPVVDASHVVVGVARERELGANRSFALSFATSSPLVVRESISVDEALRLLASAHLREVTVVGEDGVPIGVFRDVEGLRALAQRRAK
jgi:CBS domain-containing protein